MARTFVPERKEEDSGGRAECIALFPFFFAIIGQGNGSDQGNALSLRACFIQPGWIEAGYSNSLIISTPGAPEQKAAGTCGGCELFAAPSATPRPTSVVSFIDKTNVLTIAAASGLKKPLIISERTDPCGYELGRLWNVLRRLTYTRAAALVCPTSSGLEKFRGPRPVCFLRAANNVQS